MVGLLLLIFFVFWVLLVISIVRGDVGRVGQVRSRSAVNKHGHRCYIEGLSSFEREVVNTLSNNLNHKDYFIFNNLILPKSDGSSTQIDHLVVSKYGIFVIESKDYKGWIFGNRKGKVWTQSLPRGYKYSLQNPLRQNWGHVATLKDIMPFVGNNFYSVVVFSERCEFKTPRIDNVVYLSELVSYLKKAQTPRLSDSVLLMAIGKLSYMCQAVDITTTEHISNVQAILRDSMAPQQREVTN